MNGHTCPECGTDRGAASDDGRPGCGCAERAAAALRAERSAEIAEAADFHPLRIRPYVTLRGPSEAAGAGSEAAGDGRDGGTGSRETVPLVVPMALPGAGDGPPPAGGAGHWPAPVYAPVPLPAPVPEPDTDTVPGERRRKPGLGRWLAVGAVAAAVVGTGAFAGGLFAAPDEYERALPDTVTSAPSASESPAPSASRSAAVSPPPSASASKFPSASASVAVSPSASVSRSAAASPSPSASSALPKPAAPSPSATPSTAQATGTVEAAPEGAAVTTLSRGDRGPEVAELQGRLKQVWLYNGPEHGQFNDRVEQAVSVYQSYKSIEGDPEGVYGPNTRAALEAETQQP
ncbi:peptidoglycan-binding protein [Streptomyces hypolithicus]